MKPGEFDQILNLAKINQDTAQTEMQEADKIIKKLVNPGKSLGQYAQQHFNPIVERMKNNDITEEEAEQLKLFAGEDMQKDLQSNTKALQMKATSMLFDLVEPLFRKDITQQVQKLNKAQIKEYAAAQSRYYRALIQYGACIVVVETLTNEKANCENLTHKQLIDKTLDQHIAIVESEDIKSYFHMEIVNAINSFYEFAFNPQKATSENLLRVSRTPVKISTSMLSKPYQKIDEIQKAMTDPQFQEYIAKYGGVPVDISANRAGYNVYVSITDTIPEATTTRKLTEWDRAVFKGVCNILDCNADATFLTVQNVYAGMTINGRLTPAREKKIADSLNKMRQIDVVIQCAEQQKIYAKQKKPKHIERHYQNYMFPAATYVEKVKHPNGKEEETTIWKLFAEPPMYSYNNALSHKRTFKAKDIELPGIAMTDNVVILRDIILERIAIAENRKGKDAGNYAKINYEMLYKKIQTNEDQPLSRVESSRVRKQVKKILEQYKSKGLIASYSEYTTQSSNKARGIQIETPAKREKSLNASKKNR